MTASLPPPSPWTPSKLSAKPLLPDTLLFAKQATRLMNNTPDESSKRCSLTCQHICNTRLVGLLYKTPIPLIYHVLNIVFDSHDRSNAET